MGKLLGNKKSKRSKLSTKYNIASKVREHRRRMRKEAKKMGTKKPNRKEPGIPNSWPFKAQMLAQLERQHKSRAKEIDERRQAAKEKQKVHKSAILEERQKWEHDMREKNLLKKTEIKAKAKKAEETRVALAKAKAAKKAGAGAGSSTGDADAKMDAEDESEDDESGDMEEGEEEELGEESEEEAMSDDAPEEVPEKRKGGKK